MKKFFCETHLHTSESSACATIDGAGQARRYKRLGYSTVIVTDHFVNGNSTIDRSLSWEKQIDQLCKGYENAKAEGDKIGLNVLFGFEFSYKGADFLTYGLDKEWLKSHSEVRDLDIIDYLNLVHESGGFIVHAHPFREAWYITEIKLIPQHTDCVEVFNSSNSIQANERAKWYAESFNLYSTGGTDNHSSSVCDFCAVVTDTEIKTIQDYISAIYNRKVGIEIYTNEEK